MLLELIKIKRSPVWLICVITPVLAIAVGVANYTQNQDELNGDWSSFTAQTGLFYSLIFFALSAGVVSSTIWNEDKVPNNWNNLLIYNGSILRIIAGKIIGAMIVVGFMHLIYCTLTILVGYILKIQDINVLGFIESNLLPLITIIPLIAAQNLISLSVKSFSGPIGFCLGLSILSFVAVSNSTGAILRFLIPHSLSAFSLSLGSPAFSIEVGMSPAGLFVQTCLISLYLTIAFIFINYLTIKRMIAD